MNRTISISAIFITITIIAILPTSGLSQRSSYSKKFSKISPSDVDESAEGKLNRADTLMNSNLQQALTLVQEALAISIEAKDLDGQGDAYFMLGKINAEQGAYQLAEINYRNAIDSYELSKNEEGRYKAYQRVGKALELSGDLDGALERYFVFLEMARNKSNTDDEINTRSNIAGVYKKQGKYDKSKNFYEDVLKREQFRNNRAGELNTNNELGRLYQDQDSAYQALQFYGASKEIAQELGDEKEVNQAYDNLSSVFKEEQQIDEALEIEQEAYQYNYKRQDTKEIIDNQVAIGNLYLEKKQSDKAIGYLEEGLALAERTNDIEGKSKALEGISKAYDEAGNKEEALKAYKEHLELEKIINARRQEQSQAQVERGKVLLNAQNQIDLLQKDMELGEKTIELMRQEQSLQTARLQRQAIINYALIGGIAILIITALLVYRSFRSKRRANQLLTLKSLRGQMNPHFIFNALNSVNNYISQNNERAANQYLSEFSRLMRQVMEHSQEEFISLSDEINILELYLKLEHSRFTEKFDYTFEIDPKIDREAFPIPPMLIQPYIENAVWHGLRYKEEKGYLKITMLQQGKELLVTIEDNGIGRKHSQEKKTKNQKTMKSTGMKNIDHRLRIINDLYKANVNVSVKDLHTQSKEGTVVEIRISENASVRTVA